MEKVFKVFASFEEADQDDHEYYASLTPQERLAVCFEIRNRHFQLNNIDPEAFSLRKFPVIETGPFRPSKPKG